MTSFTATSPVLKAAPSLLEPRTAHRWDRAVEFILIAMLTFAPLAFGAVHAWSELVVLGLATALALCVLGKFVTSPREAVPWTLAHVPVGFFLLFAVVQLVPLPAGFVSIISPNTVRVPTELVSDLPGFGRFFTISLYPYGTRHDLRTVLIGATVFAAVFTVYRHSEQVKRLLAAVSIIGGAIAVLALVQDWAEADRVYGMFPVGRNHFANSGPFANHSHFAQFMNLSIGAGLGLLLVKLREMFPHGDVQPARLFEVHIDNDARTVCLVMPMMVMSAAAIVLSLSRGGVIGLIAASILTGIVIASTRRKTGSKGAVVALLALVAFGVVLWFGFDSMAQRFETGEEFETGGGRLQILRDMRAIWKMFPIFGTGLGTHSTVFPMVDTSSLGRAAVFAENEYAQLMEEMGIVGVLTLAVFITMVWIGYARCIRRHRPVYYSAIGLGYGLFAVMIQSLSDFGQHVLANVILSAAFCGLLLSLPQWSRGSASKWGADPVEAPPHSLSRRIRSLVAGGLVVIVLMVMIPGSVNATRAASHVAAADQMVQQLQAKDWDGDNDEFGELIGEQGIAADIEPDNVKFHYYLAEYMWRSLDRLRTSNGGWLFTDEHLGYVAQIVEDLQAARLHCPTYGPLPTLAGRLELFVLGDEAGERDIRLGRRLSPQNANANLISGRLEARRGNWDASLQALTRAAKLNPSLFPAAVQTYFVQTQQPDLAVAMAGNDPQRILYVANLFEKSALPPEQVQAATDQLFVTMKSKCSQPDVAAELLASLADWSRRRGERADAIDLLRRAVASDHGQTDWHFMLASLLEETGQLDEAQHEAEVVVRQRPALESARKMVKRLEARMATRPVEAPAPTPASDPDE